MKSRGTALALAAGILLTATITTGCTSTEPPAVCSAVDSLKASISDVKAVNLDAGGLTELKDDLAQVKTDLGKVKDDATSEFATEIDAVEQASASVGTSVNAAIATPSVQAMTDVGTAVQTLGSTLTALEDALKSTC